MLIPAGRLLAALSTEFGRLLPKLDDAGTDGSAGQGIANALLLLSNRETAGSAFVDAQVDALCAVLAVAEYIAPHGNAAMLREEADAVRAAGSLAEKEAAWRDLLARTQDFAGAMAGDPALSPADRARLCAAFVAWEAQDRLAQAAPADAVADSGEVQITRENLTAYLRDRFAEPGLEVTALTPLAGGFGKETILFDVAGQALSGSFVMRRDLAGGASLTNDCHRNAMEYPVILAAHARGFPAPDAVFLDTEHAALPGGDFFVMRKSPGKIGGNFFGAQTAIPADLVDSMAQIMARLHRLEPLTELGNHNPAIRAELWTKTRSEAARDYIAGWREYFLANNHMPSPSLMALYGWLLDNVPDRRGRPSLLHGDFGFHNFLFDDGKLTAVLDWEFAHIGDPAEELGYVRETIGDAIDWQQLTALYEAAGGDPVDEPTLRYFRVWAHVRNASASNLISANFIAGLADDLKLAYLAHVHFPMFISAAQALIAGGGV
ncbi:phosphotransferase family protein [Novosphingobium lentum]|uniref:phosphotransferase family protein n=1 Tax=Novosphingobium lentum TaxID=145287 RepID=UPI00082989B5|nr:phosphotransferase family protein [Novosphingobium lentum]